MKKVASLIVSTMLILLFFTAAAQASPTGGGVSMSVDVGYDGRYVVGCTTPVTVTVKNTGKEISGTLELQTGTDFTVLVRRDVVLPQDTEKQFTLFVMASGVFTAKDFEVKLKSGNSTLASAVPKTVSGIDPDKGLCGILSDDAPAVSYLMLVTFSQYGAKSWVELTKDGLYADAGLLESFSVIAINDFDSGSLTQDQRDAVEQWVYAGGTLVIGTGPGREAALGQWKDFLGGLASGGIAEARELAGLSSLGQGKDYPSALPVLNIKNTGWTVDAHAENGVPLILQKSFGNGAVFLTSFDMGDGGMSAWAGNGTMWQTLFDRAAGSGQIKNGNPYYNGYYGPGGVMNMALQTGFAGGGVVLLLFVAVLVLFTAAAGFVSYAVLRKMGRQKLMWLTIPALAVLCSLFLLLCGRTSFGRMPYMFALTSTDATGGVALSERTLAFSAPAMGRYSVSVDGIKRIFPVQTPPDYYGPSSMQQAGSAKKDVSVVASADSARLDFLNVNLNGSREAQFDTFSRQSPLELTCRYDGKTVNCALKNTSGYPMNDLAVIIGDDYKYFVELKAGEEEDFTLALDQTPIGQNIWELINSIYPITYNGMFGRFSMPDQMKTLKAEFINEEIGAKLNSAIPVAPATPGVTSATGDLGEALVVGWLDRPFGYTVDVNGRKAAPKSLELVTATVPISNQGGENGNFQILRAYAQLNATLTTPGNSNMDGTMLTVNPGGSSTLDLSLAGSSAYDLSDLTFDAGVQSGMAPGTWTMFNWSTQSWDAVLPKQHFGPDDLKRYISPEGLVRVAVKTGTQDYLQCTPYVWAQGVLK